MKYFAYFQEASNESGHGFNGCRQALSGVMIFFSSFFQHLSWQLVAPLFSCDVDDIYTRFMSSFLIFILPSMKFFR